MTKRHYVERKAEDLKMGDMYVSWAKNPKVYQVYPEARRILNIAARPDVIHISLDDLGTLSFKPGMLLIVEELA